ncbi:MAG TPA: deoxyhypusine synthase family protein, partial [bacterium]|nr:deoxyhypusine synthase family protein [bacterium]
MADDKSKSGNTKNKSKNKECKNYQGRMIEPLDVMGNGNVKAFIDEVFGASGYNARRLGEACDIYTRMAESGATIALTLAGAMTPIGMSGPIIELMKRGLVDVIISTGANLYHDFHRAYNFPVIQGSPHVDDALLNKRGIARIYDTYIMDDDTLLPTDAMVLDASFEHK